MVVCITFGKLNHKYKYILYSAVSLLISDFAFGINYHNVFKGIGFENFIHDDDERKKFNQHYYIRQIFCYIGTYILSIILYKCEVKKNRSVRNSSIKSQKSSSSDRNSGSNNSNLGIQLIYEDYESFSYSNRFVLKLLFLILLWVIEEKFTEKLNNILKHIDFWMFEFIFLIIFCKKYFKLEIYRHQILAMLLTIFPLTLKIVTIILSFDNIESDEMNSDNSEPQEEILYVTYPLLIPIGIIMYLSMKIMRAYIKTQIKWYMDIKYISINKLLMNYGIIGTIFYTLICTITTFIECSKGDPEIIDYFCGTKDDKDNKYFASFKLYFTNFFNHPIIEILAIIFGALGFSFYKFFSLMIIKNLTPIHLVFSLPLFYIMRKIVLQISFFTYDDFQSASETYQIKYRLDLLGDFLCLFAYLIYLEIIKLNFCKLNYNLRDSIITRGQTELCSKNLIIDNDDESSIGRGDTKISLMSCS